VKRRAVLFDDQIAVAVHNEPRLQGNPLLRVPPDASLGNPLAVAFDKEVVAVFNKASPCGNHLAQAWQVGEGVSPTLDAK
jgi:hypothetical protein